MTKPPECWPPPNDPGAPEPNGIDGTEVPLFPLSGVWLYPGAVLPLFIFEPRYREMIEDSLDGPGRLVLGSVQCGHEKDLPGAPPIYPVAGIGEIGRHERRADGCYVILLVGLARVTHTELESDRLYRRVRVNTVNECPVDALLEDDLRTRLTQAIRQRTDDAKSLPDGLPVANLADFLMLRMQLPGNITQALYCELDITKRAQGILAEHERRGCGGGDAKA